MFLPHPRVKVSIVGSLRDREVACSASDRQGSNFESCVWRTVSSQSSHHPQEVLLAQFSLYVHKGGLKPDSIHFFFWTKKARNTFNISNPINLRLVNTFLGIKSDKNLEVIYANVFYKMFKFNHSQQTQHLCSPGSKTCGIKQRKSFLVGLCIMNFLENV